MVLEVIFSFPWGSFPFWGSKIELRCAGEGWVLPVPVSTGQGLRSSPLPPGALSSRAKYLEGLGLEGRAGSYLGTTRGLFLIFPSPLESTKIQISCLGFNNLKVTGFSLGLTLWSRWCGKNWTLWLKLFKVYGKNSSYVFTFLLSKVNLSVLVHFNEHNIWCITRFQ